MGFFPSLFLGLPGGSVGVTTRIRGADVLTGFCVAAVPKKYRFNDCLALASQCVGSTGLGLAHRIVGIVALALYFIPHINYVRMGQRDVRQMPYSAYRWVARMFRSVPQCSAAPPGDVDGLVRCRQHLAAAQRHRCCCCSCRHSCRISTCSMLHIVLRVHWHCQTTLAAKMALKQAGISYTCSYCSRSAVLQANLTAQEGHLMT